MGRPAALATTASQGASRVHRDPNRSTLARQALEVDVAAGPRAAAQVRAPDPAALLPASQRSPISSNDFCAGPASAAYSRSASPAARYGSTSLRRLTTGFRITTAEIWLYDAGTALTRDAGGGTRTPDTRIMIPLL